MSFTLIVVLGFLVRPWSTHMSNPATFAYLMSMLIGAAFPIAFASEYIPFLDIVVSVAIFCTTLTSSLGQSRRARGMLFAATDRGGFYAFLMLFFSVLYLLPGLFFYQYPIIIAITDGLFSANLARQLITKEVFASQMALMLIFRFGMLLPAFSIGYSFQHFSRLTKGKVGLALFIACAVSLTYVQKSNPLFILVAFSIGRVISGNLSRKGLLQLAVLAPVLIFLTGYVLYGGSAAVIFMKDMIFRRMSDVPLETLAAHFDYYHDVGAQYLRHNFTFLTGNVPLPRLIYSHIGGALELGWANSFYIGDLIVNFGMVGVVLFSFLLGLLLRIGNAAAVRNDKWFGKNLALFALGSFIFSLSNNAFFSSVQIILLGLFLTFLFFGRLSAQNQRRMVGGTHT